MRFAKKLVRMLKDALVELKHSKSSGAGHIRTGKLGEDLAVNALVEDGYKIIERNAKVYKREVDVIAKDGDLLVFIEVKARRDHSFGSPLEAVDNKRRSRLRKAANLYLMSKKLKNVSVRFDVVTVDIEDNGGRKLEILKNAF